MTQTPPAATPAVPPEGQVTVEKEIPPFLLKGANHAEQVQTIASVPLSSIEFHEQARDTVRAEAMVNLAVGVTLVSQGRRSITVTPETIEQFNKQYRVISTPVGGGFTVEVVPK